MGYNKSWSQLGGIKMIIIPSYLRETAEKLNQVMKMRLAERPHNKELQANSRRIKKIINELQEDGSPSGDYYINMINVMDEIIKISDTLSFKDYQRVFMRTDVEEELIDELQYAAVVHLEMLADVEMMLKIIKDPGTAIEKVDFYCDSREFKLVKTEKLWQNIAVDSGTAYDLTSDAVGMPHFNHIKVFFRITYKSCDDAGNFVKKVKQHLIEVLGEERFESKKKAFEKLFKLGVIGTYYIYVPS